MTARFIPPIVDTAETRAGTVLAVALLSLCMAACDGATPPSPTARAVVPNRTVRADSGVWSSAQNQSRWRSVVRAGHVREIHESVVLYGSVQGTRVFEYDTAGVLRRVTEQTWRFEAARDSSAADTVTRSPAPRRESVVDFHADGPVMASRRFRDRPERMSRHEMRTLYVRGYALLNRALR